MKASSFPMFPILEFLVPDSSPPTAFTLSVVVASSESTQNAEVLLYHPFSSFRWKIMLFKRSNSHILFKYLTMFAMTIFLLFTEHP